jgi:Protein of unknown function (DUF3618)
MADRSDELKHEIEQTREQMGETADALAYKVDVPTRTKEWVGDKKDSIVSAVTGATSKVGEVTPDGQQVTYRVGRMKRLAERNPLGLAIAGAGAGLIAGLLLPSTRVEDERMGAMADDVKSSAAEAGREALDRGKHVAEEVGSAALEAAKESGREEGEELTATLQEKAREVLPGDGHTTVTQREPSSASTSR